MAGVGIAIKSEKRKLDLCEFSKLDAVVILRAPSTLDVLGLVCTTFRLEVNRASDTRTTMTTTTPLEPSWGDGTASMPTDRFSHEMKRKQS